LAALQIEEANRRAQNGIQSALESIGDTIMELRDAHSNNSEASSRLVNDLQESLLNSFYRLGLTDHQEKFLQDMVGDFMARMALLLNRGAETQEALQRLSTRLGELRSF